MGLLAAMNRLKVRIHGTKIPLSKRGQYVMGLVYFSVPVALGYISLGFVQRQELKNRAVWTQHMQPPEQPAISIADLQQPLRPDVTKKQ